MDLLELSCKQRAALIIPIGSALSLADEKAECVTMSMTNYLCRNARAVLATSGQITLVWRLLSMLELWVHQLHL